uniref:Hydroxylamine oxidase n=1 Tax=Thermodesulfovibrio aggregans TaxID=86166 RepID=A0A7C4EL54_9BACT
MRIKGFIVLFLIVFLFFSVYSFAEDRVSKETQICLGCHKVVTPGIVSDWKNSKHSIKNFAGCAECHVTNVSRIDSFDHNGFKIHTVVTPSDCAGCHPEESDQYTKNMMSYAYGNLVNNPIYKDLMNTINGIYSALTEEDSCLSCHGTKIEVKELKERETMMGAMKFPVIKGWPNTGVGRLNPDGSKGSCSACHTRHSFSVEIARKPETCSTCHKGPDVPAYKVYTVSKHGKIYSSKKEKWNFETTPWKAGIDFSSPTCAVCHVSQININGQVIVKRTHQMNDRLAHRLFGVPYATAHPKSPDTTIAKNKAGLPLFSELSGQPVTEYLIDENEQKKRISKMKLVCSVCHVSSFIDGHFSRLDESIKTTNDMTLQATGLLLDAWKRGLANKKDSLFNETIESLWTEQWLFYANSVRFASAMGGADYGVFDNGRWNLSRNIQKMSDWIKFLEKKKK